MIAGADVVILVAEVTAVDVDVESEVVGVETVGEAACSSR